MYVLHSSCLPTHNPAGSSLILRIWPSPSTLAFPIEFPLLLSGVLRFYLLALTRTLRNKHCGYAFSMYLYICVSEYVRIYFPLDRAGADKANNAFDLD